MINYNIPETVYDKLMIAICKEYGEKLDQLSFIANHMDEGRYELPKTVEDRMVLKRGIMTAYIKKPSGDLFDIEYKIEYKINATMFVGFVNKYLIKHWYKKFNFDDYTHKNVFYNDLARFISKKYNINTKLREKGKYLQFDVTVWMHPDTRIIYVK